MIKESLERFNKMMEDLSVSDNKRIIRVRERFSKFTDLDKIDFISLIL